MKAVLVVLVALVVFSEASVLGVKPENAKLYTEGKEFTCLDGSQTLDWAKVNDDYCDCVDGSDEPGTSACSNGVFWCLNRGHVGREIPSSMVQDGVCDCCDGSDERECENTCESLGLERRKEIKREIRTLKKGLQAKKVMVEDSIEEYQKEFNGERSKLIKESVKVTDKKEDKEQLLQGLQEQYNDAKAIVDLDIPDRKHQTRADRIREDELQDDDEDIRNTELQGVEDDVNDDSDDKEDPEAAAIVALKAEQKEKLTKAFIAKWNTDPERVRKQCESIEKEIKQLEKEEQDIEDKLDTIEEKLKLDFINGTIYGSYKKVVTYRTDEYTYSLSLFDEVKQGTTNLGKFEKWTDGHSGMIYSKGRKCWGGPDRSTKLHFVCGTEWQILSVDEPDKCEYYMQVATPYGCHQEQLDVLTAELEGNVASVESFEIE